MHCWELKLLFTVVTGLLVKGKCSLLHAVDLAFHGVDVLHVFLHLVVVFIDALYLCLEFIEQELLQNFKP